MLTPKAYAITGSDALNVTDRVAFVNNVLGLVA